MYAKFFVISNIFIRFLDTRKYYGQMLIDEDINASNKNILCQQQHCK